MISRRAIVIFLLSFAAILGIITLLLVRLAREPAPTKNQPPKNEPPKAIIWPSPIENKETSKPASQEPKPEKPPAFATVKVLNIAYYPLVDNHLDQEETELDYPLEKVRAKVARITSQLEASLEKGSQFRGYKNPSAPKFANYQIVENKEFLEKLPPPNPQFPGNLSPDYQQILNRLNICQYVDNQDLKEVWLWGYHTKKIAPAESNMAMGAISKNFWNNQSYGDVSNSGQYNDMPTCRYTYTLYNYNYGRDIGEALEDHTHQAEAILNFVEADFFTSRFIGRCGEQPFSRCGWTHYPPNVMSFCQNHDYDWHNERTALSDCLDWTPDSSGKKELVSCHTWDGEICGGDGGTNFKIWWLQNLPGKDNALTFENKCLRNWWEFLTDFDSALSQGKSLVGTCP